MNQEFLAELLRGHKGAAVEVPFDPAQIWEVAAAPLWPGRRGKSVQGSLNDVKFGSCIVPRSGRFWLLVDEEIHEKAYVSVGEIVRRYDPC